MSDDGFTSDDRLNLNNVCRDVQWMKDQHEKRVDALEERFISGEKRLHERVDEVHSRVNKFRNFFIGFAALLSSVSTGIGFWLKSLFTGGNP